MSHLSTLLILICLALSSTLLPNTNAEDFADLDGGSALDVAEERAILQTAVFTLAFNSSCVQSGTCQGRITNVVAIAAGAVATNFTFTTACVPVGSLITISSLNVSTSFGMASIYSVQFEESNSSIPTSCVDLLQPRTSVKMAQDFVDNVNAAISLNGAYYFKATLNDTFAITEARFPIPDPGALTSTAQVFSDGNDGSSINILGLGLGLGLGMGCLLCLVLCCLAPFIIPIGLLLVLVVVIIILLPFIVVILVILIIVIVIAVAGFLIIAGVAVLIVGFTLRKTVYAKRMKTAQDGQGGGGGDDFGPGFDDDL